MLKAYREINILMGNILESDPKLLGMEGGGHFDENYYFPCEINNMANLLKEIEIFSSTSEARRNGFNKPIPEGYSEHRFKHYRTVYILRIC